MLKERKLSSHSSTVNNTLNEYNRQHWIYFCVKHTNINMNMFEEIMYVVHIDGKWFQLNQNKRNYYLGNEEGEPRFKEGPRASTQARYPGRRLSTRRGTQDHHGGRCLLRPSTHTQAKYHHPHRSGSKPSYETLDRKPG